MLRRFCEAAPLSGPFEYQRRNAFRVHPHRYMTPCGRIDPACVWRKFFAVLAAAWQDPVEFTERDRERH